MLLVVDRLMVYICKACTVLQPCVAISCLYCTMESCGCYGQQCALLVSDLVRPRLGTHVYMVRVFYDQCNLVHLPPAEFRVKAIKTSSEHARKHTHGAVQISKYPQIIHIRKHTFLYPNSYLLTLEAISRACSGHPKGRLSFGSLSLWKILAMIIAEGLLNVASRIKNRP